MAALTPGSFELDGYLIADDAAVTVTTFTPGTSPWNTADANPQVGNVRRFGRDYLQAPEWDFEFVALGGSISQNIANLEALAGKWLSASRDPGFESTLRYNMEGKTRLIHGRPRRFNFNPTDARRDGFVVASATFQATDPFQYDDVLRTVVVPMVPGASGGLTAPLTAPLSTTLGSSSGRSFSAVGGAIPAPFTAVIEGPISNPSISTASWTLKVNTTLAFDQSLTIDTRLHTVLRNDGASLAGKLTRQSARLHDARLKPSATNIQFGGTDATGTSSLTLTWRPTYLSY